MITGAMVLFFTIAVGYSLLNSSTQDALSPEQNISYFSGFNENTIIKMSYLSKEETINKNFDIKNSQTENFSDIPFHKDFYMDINASNTNQSYDITVIRKKNSFNFQFENLPLNSTVSIISDTQYTYENVPVDWAGNIAFSDISANESLCLNTSLPNEKNKICYQIDNGGKS